MDENIENVCFICEDCGFKCSQKGLLETEIETDDCCTANVDMCPNCLSICIFEE